MTQSHIFLNNFLNILEDLLRVSLILHNGMHYRLSKSLFIGLIFLSYDHLSDGRIFVFIKIYDIISEVNKK